MKACKNCRFFDGKYCKVTGNRVWSGSGSGCGHYVEYKGGN
ncbi:MAG: hypothetical protein ACRC8M_13600 [Cetobacterium sp.]